MLIMLYKIDFTTIKKYIKTLDSYVGKAPSSFEDIPDSSTIVEKGVYFVILQSIIQYGSSATSHDVDLVDSSNNIIVHNGVTFGNFSGSSNSIWVTNFNYYTFSSDTIVRLRHKASTGSNTAAPRYLLIRIG